MSCNTNRLDEIADVIDSLHKTPQYSENGYPMVRATDVKYGYLNLENTLRVQKSIFEEFSRRYIPNKDDIVITRVGSYGITSLVKDTNFCLGQNTSVIVPKINARYLYFALNSSYIKNQIENSVVGSTQKTLSLKAINSLEIPRFNEETEKKIAHILSVLDDKIELNRKMNQTLESMASEIFKSWFVNFDPVHAKANCESEAELENIAKELGISKATLELFPSEFIESELGMIPKGWKMKTFEDIVDFQNGYSFKSNELHENPINSTKVFKMGHINRGGGFKEEGKDTYFTVDDKKKMERYYLKKGDLLMAMTDMKANMALLAHTALMPYNDLYLLNQRVGRLRVKENCKIGYSQLYIFTNYQDTVQDLRSRSNSGVQVNLTTKAILETKILMAPDELLEKFNMIVEPLFEKMFKNDDEVISLQKTRNTLLPKLLSGEIDVSELEIK